MIQHTLGGRYLSTDELIGRLGFLAMAAYSFHTGLKVYSAAGIWAPSVPLGLVMYGLAACCLGGVFWVREPLGRRAQSLLGIVLLVALGTGLTHEISHANPGYGTDAIAFADAGGEVLLAGDNPYAVAGEPLGPVLEQFGVPATFVTRSLDGRPIDRLISYPAGHVLVYTAGAAVGIEDMRWVTLVFELAAVSVMWWVLLPSARSALILVLLIEPNLMVLFTSGGVTDWIWVLPMLLAALALAKRRFGWAGVASGVACAIKQQPWFAIPFVLVWVYQVAKRSELHPRESIGAFAAGLVAAFGVLNLPFIVWSPGDWVQGVLAPAISNLVPDGQGLSVLASRGILPIPQEVFAILTIVAFGSLLAMYILKFDRSQDLLWVLPAVLFLFSYRSFHNYFVYWLPLVLFWVCLRADDEVVISEKHKHRASRSSPLPPALVAILVVIAASGAAAALMVGGAAFKVGQVLPNVTEGVITSLDIELTNTSAQPATPVIDVYWSGWPVPWRPESGMPLGPGETRVVRALPTSPEVVPTLRTTNDGVVYQPFRVRVNAKGHSEFSSSPLIQLPAYTPGIVNPHLTLWGRSNHTVERAPLAWSPVSLRDEGTDLVLGPAAGGEGAVLRVANREGGRDGWAETGLIQEVPALSSCYLIRLWYTAGNEDDSTGYPIGYVGLQFIQDTGSVWFVPSTESYGRTTDLPGDTRIVEMPVPTAEWTEVTLELGAVAYDSGIEIGKPGTVKIFNSLRLSEQGPQEWKLSYLSECSESSL